MRYILPWLAGGTIVAIGLFSMVNTTRGEEKENLNPSAKLSASQADHAEPHAALGVTMNETATGVRVATVLPGSPAARAGIQVGDEILYLGEQRIRTPQNMIEEINEYHPGSQVDLQLRRNVEKLTVTATLASRSATFGKQPSNQPMSGQAQVNRTPARRYSSYRPGSATPSGEQQLAQEIRSLQRQVQQLQQTIYAMEGIPQGPQQGAQPMLWGQPYSWQTGPPGVWTGGRAWNDLQRHGEANDDPALFQ